jgi:SSS family solute:Na+ symporter
LFHSPSGIAACIFLAAISDSAAGLRLGWLDISIIALPLLLAFALTLYMRRFSASVADYLAAGRTAGRYLICTAQMEMGLTAAGVAAGMETFSRTGFSLNMWDGFRGFIYFLLAMSGLITVRFRETRSFTFHQFFEVRYGKALRVGVTLVNVLSSLFTMGIGPMVAARFFVYFLGLPIVLHIGPLAIPTYGVAMVVLMSASLYFAFIGGQLTIMTTDCVEGVVSSFLYLLIAFSILSLFSYHQMGEALMHSQPGQSYLDPFDVGKRPDFGYTFIILGFLMTTYAWRGNAWNAGFAASAKSAHEGQMAVVLGIWRGLGASLMGGLIGLGAFTLIHSADFAAHASAVQAHLSATITDPRDAQLKQQLLLPTALGMLLPAGVRGALCAVLLMGFIASMASGVFGFSNGLVQDMILPLLGRRLQPRRHILLLRLTAVAMAIYTIAFGLLYHIPDYLALVTQLMSAIYLAGIGAIVWGGLYWRRGTNAAAWTALIAGCSLSLILLLVQQFWTDLLPPLHRHFGDGPIYAWLSASGSRPPINSQILAAAVSAICLILYVTVSLLTCRVPYDLDKLLHRGKYRLEADGEPPVALAGKFRFSKLAGVNENYSKGDRRIAYFTFWWGITPNLIGILVVVWNLAVARWSLAMWWKWNYFWSVLIPLVAGVITTIWFTWGVSKDLLQLFRDLERQQIDVTDDGQVFGKDDGTGTETGGADAILPANPATEPAAVCELTRHPRRLRVPPA